jgi:hypothetical protein
MFSERFTFLGIDPTAGGKPLTYAALDAGRGLLALGQGSLDDVLAFAAGQRHALAAVCAPQRPNQGVMRRSDVRQSLTPSPHPGRWENCRLADFLLRQRGVSIPLIPADEQACPNWMRQGFTLFRRLEELGYAVYPVEGAGRQCLEVYPHAAYSFLLGVTPYPKDTLEGRLQRQLCLYERDVELEDPLEILEEITRHRLLTGHLSFDRLHSQAELDALVAAYVAWQCAHQPAQVEALGDVDEGQVIVPRSMV